MEQRRKRRPLAAGGDIGRAKFGDDGDPEPAREGRAVAQLPSAAFSRAMQDRVAVHADNVRRKPRVAAEQLFDGVAVEPRQLGFDISDRTGAAEHAAQPRAEIVAIGDGQRRAGDDPRRAVGLDHRDIDAVERGAAHQPDRTPQRPAGRGRRWHRGCGYAR